MLFYLLLDFGHHVIEVGLLLVLFDKLVDIACSSHLRFTPELARDGSIGGGLVKLQTSMILTNNWLAIF